MPRACRQALLPLPLNPSAAKLRTFPHRSTASMQLSLLKTKIHRATVTHSELNYEGSIAIDGLLLDATGIREFEQVHIWDVTNGARFSTYAIRADEGSGIISLNGGAARHVQVGDLIIIAAFAGMSEEEAARFQPTLVYVDGKNKITHTNHSIPKQAA
jgi:aspartate 1-decarboxylase